MKKNKINSLIQQAVRMMKDGGLGSPKEEDWNSCFRLVLWVNKMEWDAQSLGRLVGEARMRYPSGL